MEGEVVERKRTGKLLKEQKNLYKTIFSPLPVIKRIFKRQDGVTLIEIIALLVIMGILASVAITKFFDLQQRASEKALYTALSELKMRVIQHFAGQLLYGKTVAVCRFLD